MNPRIKKFVSPLVSGSRRALIFSAGVSSGFCTWTKTFLRFLRPKIKKYKGTNFISVAWLILFTVAVILIFPSPQHFEAVIAAEEISFTTAPDTNQIFIGEIESVRKFTMEGSQSINLSGKFSSKNISSLENVSELRIDLVSSESQWSISPVNESSSDLTLSELRVVDQVDIDRLRLVPSESNSSLRFELTPKPKRHSTESLLQMASGTQPLKILLSGPYNLQSPSAKIVMGNQPMEIDFTPSLQNIKIPIVNKTIFSLDLPKPNKDNPPKWIRKNLKTQNVRFSRLNEEGSTPDDSFEESTILQGQIRIAEKELKLQSGQFLSWKPNHLGIQSILRIQASFLEKKEEDSGEKKEDSKSKDPEPNGLEIRCSGEASRLDVGLDKDFPVANLQAGLLSGRLPSDTVTVIISAIVATLTSFVPWLLDRYLK
jgi:hypothetical protein